MPRVSVIVNCWNGERYLKQAIDSIYAQTYSDWEIVFFDNASTDASADIARSYDERLRYIRNETTIPLGAARNRALAHVRGEYIAFLDTDDSWEPAKLEKQVPLFDARPFVGIVHSDVLRLDERDGSRTTHFGLLGHKPPRGRIFTYLLRESAISMPSAMLRAAALKGEAEWFDERFEIYPDFDLFRRIAYNWECDYVDELLAVYRIHAGASSQRNHRKAADELAMTLEKFCRTYADFESRYAGELAHLRAMVAYQKGKSCWREGDGSAARHEFARYPGSPKMLLAYFASLVPYAIVERLWQRYQQLLQAARH